MRQATETWSVVLAGGEGTAAEADDHAVRGHVAGQSTVLEWFFERVEPVEFSDDILEAQATVPSVAARTAARKERSGPRTALFFDLGSNLN